MTKAEALPETTSSKASSLVFVGITEMLRFFARLTALSCSILTVPEADVTDRPARSARLFRLSCLRERNCVAVMKLG
ncbi:hypothetical protein D3C78_1646080 [compost metagenome]